MKIRFQADADLHVPIITGLKRRVPAIDFTTANEARLAGIDDHAVLVLAASSGRVLVTHDVFFLMGITCLKPTSGISSFMQHLSR